MLIEHVFNRLSSRIIALIIFVLIANAAISSIFSLYYLRDQGQKEDFRTIQMLLNELELHSGAKGFDKTLTLYGVSIDPILPIDLTPTKNLIFTRLRAGFNKNNGSVEFFNSPEQPDLLWLRYISHQNKKTTWFMMEYNVIQAHEIFIPILEELILISILIAGSYWIAKSVRDPLKEIASELIEFGTGKIPKKVKVNGPEEIQQLADKFNHMVDDWRLLQKERELVLAGIAHDIRTPLSRIKLLLAFGTIEPKIEEDINNEIDQIIQMQQSFLDFVAYSKRTIEEIREDIYLYEFLSEFVEKQQMLNIQVELEMNQISSQQILHFNKLSLNRLIDNCLNNAIKYGKPPYIIRVTQQQAQLCIQIEDHGNGVPTENLSKIFQPLYREDQARKNATGSGLGLAIVAKICASWELTINAENIQPSGFRVSICFPNHMLS